VFQTGTDGTLYHAWQQKPNGAWSPWTAIDLHSLKGPPSAARNGSGQLEVFAMSGGIAVHTGEDSDAGGPWRQGTDDLG
jgi:hypothetical protein